MSPVFHFSSGAVPGETANAAAAGSKGAGGEGGGGGELRKKLHGV